MNDAYLVTGSAGCIGAWVLKRLLHEGQRVVAYDRVSDHRRAAMITSAEALARVAHVEGDITDCDRLGWAIREYDVGHVIHLAALQVPFCKADPICGARVNVEGTLAVFESVRRSDGRVRRISLASSGGVYGARQVQGDGLMTEDDVPRPGTLYGVYKLANEACARVYASDHGIASTAFRPMTVYGPGRDQGLTSGPSVAMQSAVLRQPYTIGFCGETSVVYVDDVAAMFIEGARCERPGAEVFNVCGQIVTVREIIDLIEAHRPDVRGLISETPDVELPITGRIDESRLRTTFPSLPRTSLHDGVGRTLETFESLHRQGRLGSG